MLILRRDPREQHATALIERSMGEYLAAPALLDEPAVQQSFLSYFNTQWQNAPYCEGFRKSETVG